MKRLVGSATVTAVAAVLVVCLGGTAMAAWLVSGSGSGLAAARSLDQAATPTLTQVNSGVTVSWAQNTVDGEVLGATTGGGYEVTRFDVNGDDQGGCTGITSGAAASLTCTEADVPAGTWTYTVIPMLSQWRGPASQPQEITVDRTGPAVTLDAPAHGSDGSDLRPTFSGLAGDADTDSDTVHLQVFSGPTAEGAAVIDRDDVPVVGGAWTFTPTADLSGGTYTATASQTDDFSNLTTDGPNTFTVTLAPLDTQKPTSTISFPATPAAWSNASAYANGCGTASTGDVCGNAGDNVGVTKVEVSIRRDADSKYWDGTGFTATTPQLLVADGTTSWRYGFAPPADGSYTLTSRATDSAGNVQTTLGSAQLRYDATAPLITFATRTAANAAGWNNTNVTVAWTCTDTGGSGVVSPTDTKTVTAEGAALTSTGTCADNAGNTTSNVQTGIKIDKTAPGNTLDHPVEGTNYRTALQWDLGCLTAAGDFCGTVSDALSGIAKVEYSLKRTSSPVKCWTSGAWANCTTPEAVTTATVTGGSWNVGFASSNLDFGQQAESIALTVKVTDTAGNTDTRTTNFQTQRP